MIKNSLNPKGHQNPISGSKVTAILLKRLILPIGGASSGRVCTAGLFLFIFINIYIESTLKHYNHSLHIFNECASCTQLHNTNPILHIKKLITNCTLKSTQSELYNIRNPETNFITNSDPPLNSKKCP